MADPATDPNEQLFVDAARATYRRLKRWEDEHPDATLGEIEQETRRERRQLMGQLMPLLVENRGRDDPATRPPCPHCGRRMAFQEDRTTTVETMEGPMALTRPYYYCRSCHEGLFPPGPGSAPGGAQ